MKKQLWKFITTSMILSVSAVFLSANAFAATDSFQIDIPFNFQVGNDTYAAGEYRFKRVGQVIISFESTEGEGERHVLGVLGANLSGSYDDFELTFHQYGDVSFLREVTAPGSKFSLARTKSEKEADRDGRYKNAKRVVRIK